MPQARTASRLEARASLLVVGVAVVSAGVIGFSLMRSVGLQYDEALFVNAATSGGLGSDSTDFVRARVLGLPVLLMDYIGALKAWLYTPIFGVFGVSIEAIRAPMVILFCTSVGVAVRLVWKLSRPWVAAVTALLLTIDPVFALMSRNDWGPVALSGFFRVVFFLAVLTALRKQSRAWLWLASGALCLGIFNKLDFGFFAVSAVVALVAVFPRQLLLLAKRLRWSALGPALAVLLTYSAAYLFMYLPSIGSQATADIGRLERIRNNLALVFGTFEGRTVVSYMTGVTIGPASLLLPACILAVSIAGCVGLILFLRRDRSGVRGHEELTNGRVLVFVVVTSAILISILAVTPQVQGPHHAAMMWPLPTIALALSLAFLARYANESRTLARRAVAVAVAFSTVVAGASLLAASIATNVALVSHDDNSVIWSREPERVAELIGNLSADNGERVIVSDWGIENQLEALLPPKSSVDVEDPWYSFVDPATPVTPSSFGLTVGKPFYLVWHTAGSEVFAGTAKATSAFVAACVQLGGSERRLFTGMHVRASEVTCGG